MKTRVLILSFAMSLLSFSSCVRDHCKEGSFGYDVAFFETNQIEAVDLCDGGQAHVLVVPAYQGRVMTSSASGLEGDSFGWINYELIASGEVREAFNPVGGEERFWLGPEGGPFSYYFKKGAEQVYANWRVPAILDRDPFQVVAKTEKAISLHAETSLVNASDVRFDIGIDRDVSVMGPQEIADALGVAIPGALHAVAYKTVNVIKNIGSQPWTKESGMPSVWMLGMFNPTETTTVFIPYSEDAEGTVVNDMYFGKVPAERLKVADGVIYFKIDGKYRSKIGLPASRAKDICGSYDSGKNVLTILKYSVPEGGNPYMNGQWGEQEDPFAGDVINSYNDGPTETGFVQGPFYEIETSSPGAALASGESLTHTQFVFHIQGNEKLLEQVVREVFGLGLETIKNQF